MLGGVRAEPDLVRGSLSYDADPAAGPGDLTVDLAIERAHLVRELLAGTLTLARDSLGSLGEVAERAGEHLAQAARRVVR